MSFSGKKNRMFLGRLVSLVTALSMIAPTFSNVASAADKKKNSYGETLSYYKEEVDSVETEIKEEEKKIKTLEKELAQLQDWENVDPDDALADKYSTANCACGFAQCPPAELSANGITPPTATRSETTANVYQNSVPGTGTGSRPTTGDGKNPKVVATDPTQTGGVGRVLVGTETFYGPPEYKTDAAGFLAICTAVYDKWSKKEGNFSPACKSAALKCGPNARDLRERRIPKDIVLTKERLKELKEKRKELVADRNKMIRECPQCAVIAEQEAKGPGLGDYIVGGLQAITPMVLAGIGSKMYGKYLNTSLSAYNGYLGNSLAACQEQIQAGITMGIPTNPCQSAMWAGGGGGGMGGGMGMGMSFGMPGGMMGSFQGGMGSFQGGMMGYPGMMGGGMMGSFQGGMMGAVGGGLMSAMGGAFQGGMMGSFQGGMGSFGGFGSFQGGGMQMAMGYPGGMMGSGPGMMGYPGMGGMQMGGGSFVSPPMFGMGGNFGYPSMGMSMGGGMAVGGGIMSSIGSPGFNMSFGMGTPGMGYPGYGMPGMGGYGMGGSFAGFSAGSFGQGVGQGIGMGFGMPNSYGMQDPSYMLNAQRQGMYGQDIMIAQQQMLEAQLRAQQVSASYYYGGGGGLNYGGFGGFGMGGSFNGAPTNGFPGATGTGNTF